MTSHRQQHQQEALTVRPGRYLTRNGRVAVITDANSTLADGYVLLPGLLQECGERRRYSCWYAETGKCGGARREYWDLMQVQP